MPEGLPLSSPFNPITAILVDKRNKVTTRSLLDSPDRVVVVGLHTYIEDEDIIVYKSKNGSWKELGNDLPETELVTEEVIQTEQVSTQNLFGAPDSEMVKLLNPANWDTATGRYKASAPTLNLPFPAIIPFYNANKSQLIGFFLSHTATDASRHFSA